MEISASAELLLLICGVAIVGCSSGLTRQDRLPLALLFIFAVLAFIISIANNIIFPDALRHIAIIAIFCLLGLRSNGRAVHSGMIVLISIIFLGLLLEIFAVDTYVTIFQPGAYFANSRGIEQPSWTDSGLFANALGFSSRFSFGLSDHRTASVFLEQVSLANFAGVLCIVLLILWDEMKLAGRLYYVSLIAMIILTNSTRTSSVLVLCSVAGFFLFPKLPRYGNMLIAPLLLIASTVYVWTTGLHTGDDLPGRISLTIHNLAEFDLMQLLGLRLEKSESLWDSGYAYMPTASSIFGFLALYWFIAFAIPQSSPGRKRGAYALSLYFFFNLMIGGNAVYSMKVAAPLWFVVGYAMRQAPRRHDRLAATDGTSRD